MNKVLFTSDLHFYHKNIVKYTDRKNVVSQEDHDQWLIDLWNSQVDKSDIVYHLGDFTFAHHWKDVDNLLYRLKGRVYMIKGNHDSSTFELLYRNHPKVAAMVKYHEIKVKGNFSCLFHYPCSVWNKSHRDSWMLHGHCHGSFQPEFGKILDVGLDNAYNIYGKHKFFTEEDIAEYMQNRKTNPVDHHTGERE